MRQLWLADLATPNLLSYPVQTAVIAKFCATPYSTPATFVASAISFASAIFIATGFSHSTAFPCLTASNVSAWCIASGDVMNTASTSGELHNSSAVAKQCAM
jgi:hypothetical protein